MFVKIIFWIKNENEDNRNYWWTRFYLNLKINQEILEKNIHELLKEKLLRDAVPWAKIYMTKDDHSVKQQLWTRGESMNLFW